MQILALACLLASTAPEPVNAPLVGEPFSYTVYTRNDGAPENAFYSLAVDPWRRLVLGMINGTARFNGSRFSRLDEGPDSPRGNTAYSIETDGNDVWVGTPSGLFAQSKGQWRKLTSQEGLPHSGINWLRYEKASTQFARAVLYVATQGGLAVLAVPNLEIIATIGQRDGLPENNTYTVLEVATGPFAGLWVAGPGGLAHRTKQEPFAMVMTPKNEAERAVRRLYLDPAAPTLWASTEGGLYRIDQTLRALQVEPLMGSVTANVRRVERGKGSSWLCVARLGQGFSCSENGVSWQHLTVSSSASSNHVVFSLDVSGRSNGADVLWLATDSGLVRAAKPSVQRIANAPPILSQRVDALLAGGDDSLWVASGRDVARWKDNRWSDWKTPDEADSVSVLSQERPGRVLLGTNLGHIFAFEEGHPAQELGLEFVQGRAIKDLVFARRNGRSDMWVGVNGGLWAWDGKSARAATEAEGLPAPWISKLLPFPLANGDDGLWIGFNSRGLARGEAGKFSALPGGLGVAGDENVTFIHRDTNDGLWVGTQAGGARRLWPAQAPSQFARFSETSVPPLPDGTINSIASDREGRVYLCTNRGIARLTQTGTTFDARAFNREDGMLDDECSMNTGALDTHGRLYFGTMHGLTMIEPAAVDEHPPPAELIFESASFAENIPLADGVNIRHDENRIAFAYALVTATHARETMYETHLVGGEAQPLGWRPDASREFTGIQAGTYEFKVRARDHLGRLHGPISRSFVVRPPPWATPAAYALYLVAAGLSVFAGMRARLRVLRNRAEALEQVVMERTAEVRAQKEELEKSYQQADRIFAALKEALKGSLLSGKYKLDAEIGQGGFGVVYRATEVRTGQIYAVKVFRPQSGNDSVEALERFKLEAKSGERFRHPNAIAIYDSGVTDDGVAYIVMELLTGHTVKQELEAHGKIDLHRCRQIIVPVCQALAAAHEQGIVHRDIKPDNVFLHEESGKEVVKVLDFGVAKLTQPTASMAIKTLTMTGAVLGTPTYMAPERLENKPYDGRSDVYSVGIMLYELIVGQPPFGGSSESLITLVMQHMQTSPRPIKELDATVPEPIQNIVMLTLEKKPERRPDASMLANLVASVFP